LITIGLQAAKKAQLQVCMHITTTYIKSDTEELVKRKQCQISY